jgi:predicted unusual protein kinase regulating ubiquinone biosynthesis (AarF/ABC1/UbiB family)
MAKRLERTRRAVVVGEVARRNGIRRVLAELDVVGHRDPTPEGARAFREALEELGTAFIKLGQLLSSRPDLLPDVYVRELGSLVDSVTPTPFAEIEGVIREDFGEHAFVRIDPEPIATASIAQTHRAVLATGQEVVVKVRRPGVVEQVELDLAVLRSGAQAVTKRSETARLVQLEELVDELAVHLQAELNLLEEAHNTTLIGELLADYERIVVPDVIQPYVSERVLTLELIEGQKVTDAHGLDLDLARELAREFFSAYVFQVVVEGVFHADPHPGNVFLTNDGRLALLDFGLIGRLDDDTRRGLSLLLLAIAQNRADDVADLITSLSLTRLDADQQMFTHEVRRTLPRVHWRPLSGIRAGESLANLQRLAIRYGIALPTSFALVGKTLAQADAIARSLYPELDPIELIEQEAFGVMATEAERRLEPTRLLANLYTQLDPVTRLPRRISHILSELEQGSLKLAIVPTGLDELGEQMNSIANRIGAAIIIGALLLSSALLARVHRFEWLALAGFVAAAVLGLYMVWKIVRTPGEL